MNSSVRLSYMCKNPGSILKFSLVFEPIVFSLYRKVYVGGPNLTAQAPGGLTLLAESNHIRAQTKQHPENAGTAAADEPPEYVASWKEVWALIVPGLFSVASIIVQGMGLRYISASLSLMLSGSCIIFTAILSVLLLKCRLNQLHLAGKLKFLSAVALLNDCLNQDVWAWLQ